MNLNYTVSLRKRSDTWSYQIFINGKYYCSKSGFNTKAEAKRAGDREAVKIKVPEKSKDTFLAVAELYINDLEVNQKFDNEIIFDWEKDETKI